MSARTEHPTPLSNATLASLPQGVPGPAYDRGQVSVGIVHVGVGGFHRAHQARYLDRLMNQGQALSWGICGVGVMPADQRMKEALSAQDGLYTLVVKNPDGTIEPTVIGSIIEYLLAADDPGAVIERMTDPKVQIVSLTVTEGGYNFNALSGQFDQTNPDVRHDLQPGAAPKTSFGLITEALDRRRQRGIAPFTIMSCDNIPGNGDAARRSFAAFATLRSPELGAFVTKEIHFPNSMVDRITPVTTDDDRAQLTEKFGIEDRWPVVCEPFMQWVLQDSFAADRSCPGKVPARLRCSRSRQLAQNLHRASEKPGQRHLGGIRWSLPGSVIHYPDRMRSAWGLAANACREARRPGMGSSAGSTGRAPTPQPGRRESITSTLPAAAAAAIHAALTSRRRWPSAAGAEAAKPNAIS